MVEPAKESSAQTAQTPASQGPAAVPSTPVVAAVDAAGSKVAGGSKKRIFGAVLGVASLAVLFYLASAVVPRILVYLTRATNAPDDYSLANSYIFGSPLLAQANGEDKIRVTAFLLDVKGRGVPDKQTTLNIRAKEGGVSTLPQMAVVQPVTDEFGRSVFEITSTVPGQFVVVASVGGLEFPQTVTLTFK